MGTSKDASTASAIDPPAGVSWEVAQVPGQDVEPMAMLGMATELVELGQFESVPPEVVEAVALMTAPFSAVPFKVATTSMPGMVKSAVAEPPGETSTGTPSVDTPSGALSEPQSPLTTV